MFFGRKIKTCCTHLPPQKEDKKENIEIEANHDILQQQKMKEEENLNNFMKLHQNKTEEKLKYDDENIDDILTHLDSEDEKQKKKIKKHKKRNFLKFQGNLLKIINENQDMVDYRLTNIARRLDSLEETIRMEIDNIKKTQNNVQEWERYLFNSSLN